MNRHLTQATAASALVGTFESAAAAEVGFYLARSLDALGWRELTVVDLFIWERAHREHEQLLAR